jgi:hypothetical protein
MDGPSQVTCDAALVVHIARWLRDEEALCRQGQVWAKGWIGLRSLQPVSLVTLDF